MPIIRSLCGQCGMGCGIRAMTGEGRDFSFSGDPVHPANSGQLCRGSEALVEMRGLEGRLLRPLIQGREVVWDRAFAEIGRRLSNIVGRYGPDSIALHVPGRLLTEDYYVANKLMKGFIGSANIDAPWSRNGAPAAHRTAFGEDVMPASGEDIDQAELILMAGDIPPVLLDRVQAAREEQGARLILITPAGEDEHIDADMHLAVTPGSQAALFSGLLLHCHDSGAFDRDFLERNVSVPPDFWVKLRQGHDLWSVARACGLSPSDIRGFYEEFALSKRVVTLFGTQDGNSASDRLASAVFNLHLATGQIGRPGSTPFAITDAPNAMGGREVGCVAGELAAHRDFSSEAVAHVARFWGAQSMARVGGLEGAALVEAIEKDQIKALLVLGGLPEADQPIRALLPRVPLVIMTTPWLEQDAAMARLIALPSPTWVEKDGTLTGVDRLISRQRRLFPLPGEARPDWWIVTQIARAMGWRDAFHYERAAEVYREHARLTAYRNDGARLLDLKRHAPISNPAYDELTPWRWGDLPFDEGRFPTPDGRARLVLE